MITLPEFSRADVEQLLHSLGMDVDPRDQRGNRMGVKPCPGPAHGGADRRFGNLHLYLNDKPRLHCFACFTLDTPVITSERVKALGDVVVGDKVLTAQGNFRTVQQVLDRSYNGNLLEITVAKTAQTLKCTPDHVFLGVKEKDVNYGRKKKRGSITGLLKTPTEIPAVDLEEGDWLTIASIKGHTDSAKYLIVPISETYYRESGRRPQFPKEVTITPDLAWLIGMYISEGSVNRGALFTLHVDERAFADRIGRISKDAFGIQAKEYQYSYKGKAQSVLLPNAILGRWLKDVCGPCAKEKRIPPFFFSPDTPEEVLSSLLEGIFDGDGSIHPHDGRYFISTISPSLAYQCRAILTGLHLSVSVRIAPEKIDKTGLRHQKSYHISWASTSRFVGGVVTDTGQSLCQIKKIHTTQVTNTPVRDLRIEHDHTYTVAGIGVHNCGWTGDLLDLVQLVNNCSLREAVKFLGGDFQRPVYFRDDRRVPAKPESRTADSPRAPRLSRFLRAFDPQEFSYTRARGFTADYCAKMGIRLCEGHRVYAGYMITPLPEGRTFEARKIAEAETFVMDLGFPQGLDLKYMREVYEFWREQNPGEQGDAVAYLDLPRVRYPRGTMRDKPFVYRQRDLDPSKDVWVCEGTAGVPKIYSNISTNVTATFGTEISAAQQQILAGFKRRIFVPDRGLPAVAMLDKISQEIPGCYVIVVDSEDHEDDHVEQLRKGQIIPAQEYVLRRRDEAKT